MGRVIMATLLSGAIFSFLFYILNEKICGIFKQIQRDLINLNKGTRHALNFAGFILAILISIYLTIMLNLSEISTGLILGFLNAIKDTCLKNNVVENIIDVDEQY